MSITLDRFSAGMTTYVTVLNNNTTTVETSINGILAAIGTGTGTGTGGTTGLNEIWPENGLVGASSFVVSTSSNTHLTFTSGAVWNVGTQTLGRATSSVQLSFVGQASGTYYIMVDGAGGVTASTVVGNTAIYTIVYNSPGFGSATRLVNILFQGDDYQRSLSGAVTGSHTRLADRLSAIEELTGLAAFFAQSGAVSGTQWSYKAGQVRNNNAIFSAAASYVSLTATTTYYVEVNGETGTVSVATAGFTSGLIPLRYLVTSSSVFISNEDRRTWATLAFSAAGVAGPGVSGTNESIWVLNLDHTSTPLSNAMLRVERGAASDVEIRWNEGSDQWEFTNDGTSYVAIGSLNSLNAGAGQQTRIVMVASAPLVMNDVGRTATSLAEFSILSLSAYVSTTTIAAMLRGYVLDSAPGSALAGGSVAGINFYLNSGDTTDATAVKVVAVASGSIRYDEILVRISSQITQFVVETASICSTKFALVGYIDLVTGVGTQRVSGTQTGLGVAAATGSHTTLASPFAAAMVRGLVYQLTTSGSMGAGSLYDIEFYNLASGAQSQLSANLLFQATQIDASAAYTTRLPWYYEDSNSNIQVHLRISNNGTTSGAFSVVLLAERYA